MSWQSEIRAWAVASAAVFCMGAIGYRVMTAPDLAPVVAHLDTATGAWANASAKQAESMTAIQHDIRVELWHVDRLLLDGSQTLQAARGAINTANDQLTHVAPLLDSTRAAVDAIPPAIKQITDDTRPIMANADGAVGDFRKFISAPAITDTLGNVATITGNAAAITTDGRKVSDKMTDDFLKPVPWYMYPVKKGSQLLDIFSAVARHTP